MNDFEATYTEITNWQKNVHYSTGGTRSKYIALNPENFQEYFFKGSKETPFGEIRYPTEFWSEIVASKIGQFLGFEMLDYNIAFDKNHKQQIGCLSKSMILHSENKLTEGISYLTGFNSKYNPEKDKKNYTFQFIQDALIDFKLEEYVQNIIEIIIFDAIIGNSDRHQENWGVVVFYRETQIETDNDNIDKKSKTSRRISNLLNKISIEILKIKIEEKVEFRKADLETESKLISHKFSPIYDSGCCLGREFDDLKVEKIINDNQMLESYVNKGESEIHWNEFDKKLKHFDLVNLLLERYSEISKSYISRIKEKFDLEKIREIINNIDSNLPHELNNFKLSDSRKKLMYKLITLRIEKLLTLT